MNARPVFCALGLLLWAAVPVGAVPYDSAETVAQDVERHNNRGVLLAGRGQYREAIQAFRSAIRLAPEFAVAHYNLGLAHSRLAAFPEAAKAFEAAVRIRPDYGDAWYHLGAARQAQGRFEAAADAYRSALPFKPDQADLRYRLGLASLKLEDWASVVTHWEALRARHPDHAAVPKIVGDLPRAYYNLGTAHQNAGRAGAAIAAYGQALRMRTGYVEAYRNLGIVYREEGRLAESVSAFRQALRFQPESPDILSKLGGVYALQDSLDRAAALYREALRNQENYDEARYGLVDTYLRQGDVERAEYEALAAVEHAPDAPESYAFLAYVYEHNAQGQRYGKDYRASEAVRTYRHALKLAPDNAGLHYNLGVIYGRQANWPDALIAFEKALEIDSTHVDARKWLPKVKAGFRAYRKKRKAKEQQ